MKKNELTEITESDAQHLANISNCVICVDKNGSVIISLYKKQYPVILLDGLWHIHVVNHMFLNVRVISNKPWEQQIWIPE